MPDPATTASVIVPQRCYRDARAGIAFLEEAFGFAPSLIVPDATAETVVHAELWNDDACIMLASVPIDGPWEYRVPREIGGVNTGAPYLAVSDIDAVYKRATAAGCAIVTELAATDYGSRDFSALDREGFLWHFGTYRPDGNAHAPASTATQLFVGARYVDARAAMAWLCSAFGAGEQFVVPGAGDDIAHAQLALGGSIFMLGSARSDAFNTKTPREIGGAYTQSFNVYVDDPDAHYARAVAAGAEIITPLADTPYGARVYVARDPEGYVWCFGSYRPARPSMEVTFASGAS